MAEQRFPWSRRAFLAAGALTVSGVLAGCANRADGAGGRTNGSAVASGSGSTAANARDDGPVSVLSAGSLELALTKGLAGAVDTALRIESHGSSTVARMVEEGQRDPDIVTVADTELFDGPLDPPWYSTFASNAVVIAYNRNTKAGKRLGEAGTENWYDVLLDEDVRLGRTDPTQDPLGYRTLMMFELASRYYDASNLREKIPKRDQMYPETGLISGFEQGNLDATIAYRNQAVERDYEFIDLPDRIDLSNPNYEDEWYSTVSYTAPSGKKTAGGLISYGSTIRHTNPTTRAVFETETTGEYLKKFGFTVPKSYPKYNGNPPNALTN